MTKRSLRVVPTKRNILKKSSESGLEYIKTIGSLNSSLGSLKRVDTPDGLDVELSNFIADIDDIKKPSDSGGQL